jgi:hypothetical protein
MIQIFESNSPSKPKRQGGRKRRSKKPTSQEVDARARAQLDKLNPMVIPMLAVGLQNNPENSFFASSRDVIINTPHRLSDNWIISLNRWVEEQIKSAVLDPPAELIIGARQRVGPLMIQKIVKPKANAPYPTPGLMCIDKNGWKYLFKTGKAYNFEAGEYVSFSGKLSGHGEGISFFKRPTKIEKVIPIDGCEAPDKAYTPTAPPSVGKIDIF